VFCAALRETDQQHIAAILDPAESESGESQKSDDNEEDNREGDGEIKNKNTIFSSDSRRPRAIVFGK